MEVAVLPAPELSTSSHVCAPASDTACFNENITLDELCSCIKRLQHGIDGIVADMVKYCGDLVKECLLWLLSCMLASHFPERLSVGRITVVYKSGDKSDMSNYRGITFGSVIAKLFAMILEYSLLG